MNPQQPTQPPTEPVLPQYPSPPPSLFPAGDGAAAKSGAVGLAPVPTPKSRRIVGVIAAIVAGLVMVGLIIWGAWVTFFNTIALQEYRGEGYTMLVPTEYDRTDYPMIAQFTQPDVDEAKRSEIVITAIPIEYALQSQNKESIMATYDEMLSEERIGSSAGKSKIVNFKKKDTSHQGYEARDITYDTEANDGPTGSVRMLAVYSSKWLYLVSVTAHTSDTDLVRASGKIVGSFRIDE